MTVAGILVLAATCIGLPTVRPFTSRGAESDWGEPSDGLSVAFALNADTVSLGDELPAEVFFRYLPFHAGARPHDVLYRSPSGETCELVFRDPETGREHVRRACPTPIFPPPVSIEVIGAGRYFRRDRFLMCTCSGEPVPAGRYEAFVRYANDGRSPFVGPPDPATRAWSGLATTAPVPFTILPAAPEEVSCRVPTGIVLRVDPDTHRLEWNWNPDSWRETEVLLLPGYSLRIDWREWVRIDGKDLPKVASDAPPAVRKDHFSRYGFAGMASGWWLDFEWGHPDGIEVLGPRFAEVVRPDHLVQVRVHAVLVQSPSRWLCCEPEPELPPEWERDMAADWTPRGGSGRPPAAIRGEKP